jgi:hypothetical protein
MLVWAIFCLVFIPEPASTEWYVWEKIAEYLLIPISVYIFHRVFTSRSEINNKTIKDLTTGMEESKNSIQLLQQGSSLVEFRLNQEVRDREKLETEFRAHRSEVDRAGIFNRNNRS